jgi:ribonuclease MRP protein subunit RMP1
MAPKPPLDPEQLKLLRDDSDLLHLLFHRNKNQHSITLWWQWFATLRRNLNKLLAEHDLITASKNTPDRKAALQKYTERVAFMRKVVVPATFEAFGNVIAQKNFAPLGLVLMACLARVWRMVKPTEEELEEQREREMEERLREVEKMAAKAKVTEEDVGVVISRDAYGGISDEEMGEVISREDYESLAPKKLSKKEKEVKATRVHSVEDRGEKPAPKDAPRIPTGKAKKSKEKLRERSDSPESSKRTKKEKSFTQEDSTSSLKKAKRKLDEEPEKKKKKKKKKGDDIDALFSGLF